MESMFIKIELACFRGLEHGQNCGDPVPSTSGQIIPVVGKVEVGVDEVVAADSVVAAL